MIVLLLMVMLISWLTKYNTFVVGGIFLIIQARRYAYLALPLSQLYSYSSNLLENQVSKLLEIMEEKNVNFKIFGKMKDSKNILTPPSQVCRSYWNRWQKRCKIQNICVTSKAALITLLCFLFLQTVKGLVTSLIVYIFQKTWLSYFEVIIVYLVYPLAGYLADNVIGRYKTFSKTIEILIYSLM